jgi:predicted nucleic acid-binding protein
MSGKRLLLDSNGIIALLQGNPHVVQLCQGADWIGISVISHLEFLCFPALSPQDRQALATFESRVEVVALDTQVPGLLDQAVLVRGRDRLRLPDAIIAATALFYTASLVTSDQEFAKVGGLSLESFVP